MELITVIVLFTGFIVVFCSTFFVFFLAQKRRFAALQESTEKQLNMATSSLVGMGNRLLDLESRLSNVRKDQLVLSDTQQDFSYTKAKKLIGQDVALDAVVASTGLSRSEVDLISLIHSQHKPVPDVCSE